MRLLTKIRIKNAILAIVVSIIAIFVPALLLGKLIQGITFFFCHWFIREQFPKQYHCTTHAMCRLVTSVVFFFGVSFCLPLGWSLFSAIPICYFISWVGYTKTKVDECQTKCDNLQKTIDDINKELPILDSSEITVDMLKERCNQVKLTKYATQFAEDVYINKLPTKELCQKYCINNKSVNVQKMRIKKKLNLK